MSALCVPYEPEGCELEPVDCVWDYVDSDDCCDGFVTQVQFVSAQAENGGDCPVMPATTRPCYEGETDVCACVYGEWEVMPC